MTERLTLSVFFYHIRAKSNMWSLGMGTYLASSWLDNSALAFSAMKLGSSSRQSMKSCPILILWSQIKIKGKITQLSYTIYCFFFFLIIFRRLKCRCRDLPGSPVVMNLPSNAEDASLIPGLGTRFHPSRSVKPMCHQWKILHASGLQLKFDAAK